MIIVTGGSGFIGTNLLCYLRQTTDEEIVSVDWRNPPFRLDGVRYDERDVANRMDINGTYPTEISTIYHLAAQAGVNCKHEDAVHSNIMGTIKVAQFAIRTGAHMVFASSGAVWAVGEDRGPIDNEYQYTSGYGISKLAGEKWLQTMICREGLSASILRLSNVYGWQPTAKSVVAAFVQAALKENEPKIVGSGLQTRDLIHVYDVVHGMLAAANKRYCGRPLDICSGKQISIRRLWYKIAENVWPKFNAPKYIDGFTGPLYSVANPCAAKEILNWTPELDLDDGLLNTVEFWKLRNQGHGPKLINKYWKACIERGWHTVTSPSDWEDLKKQLKPNSGG